MLGELDVLHFLGGVIILGQVYKLTILNVFDIMSEAKSLFSVRLKAVGITCKSSIGSTPSCSHPVQDMAKLSEVHPGNFVFYGGRLYKILLHPQYV